MHRRQGDLLEIHPCVLQDLPKTFQAFQPQDLVELLVNKPSIRMYILMLDTRNVVSNETNEVCTHVH